MHFERLVIEAGSNTFTLDLHPRLTVIAGVGAVERESLVGELVGALGSSRTGVHLELVEDSGRRLAVFRPEGGRHRVIDIGASIDVSAEFTSPDGRVDLLARAGLDLRTARRRMRLSATDLTTRSQGEEFIRFLATADQAELWAAAERMQFAGELLQTEAEAVGSVPEDAAVVEDIERRHVEFEQAQARHEAARRHATLVATGCAIAAIPAILLSAVATLPVLAVAVVTMLMSIVMKRRLEQAEQAEQEALALAGARSYLGFHLQRVNGLLSGDGERHRFMQASEEHRSALVAWQAVAGTAEVDWVLEHREEIIAAALLRKDVDALGTMSATAPLVDSDATADLVHVLVGRLSEARTLGTGGQAFPLVLDDPFVDIEPTVKPALLELLGRSSGSPQLIFLTQDEDVASWARLEALTGELTILEPTPDHESSNGTHVAA